MTGGTAWKIVKDEEEIVYAVDYNNRPDRYVHSACMYVYMCVIACACAVCLYDYTCVCVCVLFNSTKMYACMYIYM